MQAPPSLEPFAWFGGGMVIFVIVMILISVAATVIPVVLVFKWLGKNRAQRQALLQSGAPGQAKILAIGQTGMYINNNPQVQLALEVTPQVGGAPFQVTIKGVVPMIALSRVQPGSVVPVRYDPANPMNLAIDWVSIGVMV
ncbi:MAG: hypothetical protein HYY06_14445 [Deltaproteobacteria bacterium]|nr:hypothetical protein [Deltaproteobacteria bacterium]